MAGPDAPGTTTLRESWQPLLLDAVLIGTLMGILIARSDGGARAGFIALSVLLLVGQLYRLRRPVALLSPTEILVNNTRPRTIPWAAVRDVTAEKGFFSRRIVLVLDDATRVIMDGPRASVISPRGRFDRAVETIRGAWVAHRGPAPSAAPAESRPADGGPAGT
jgi:hypothetical protein